MATKRRAVIRSRITTRSSMTKHPADQIDDQEHHHQLEFATTATQPSTITATTISSPVKTEDRDGANDEAGGGCWSTPKAKRFRIPEIESCPPAPKKQKAATVGNYCFLRRSSIPFFTPPDLSELFFKVTSVPINMPTI